MENDKDLKYLRFIFECEGSEMRYVVEIRLISDRCDIKYKLSWSPGLYFIFGTHTVYRYTVLYIVMHNLFE